MLLWAVLIVLGVLAAALIVILAIGASLPREHVASRTLALAQPPEVVWPILTDFAGQSAWRPSLKSIERLPGSDDGAVVWREILGDMKIDLKVLEEHPPTGRSPGRLVRKIVNDDLPFGGVWEYSLERASAGAEPGCKLSITERGEVKNPLFRFVSRFLMGHAATIEGYLKDLARKFGEPAMIE
jgi:hypothetical protein